MTVGTRPSLPENLETFFAAGQARSRVELGEFLRIPSVSTSEEHRSDVAKAAHWLAGALRSAGLAAEVHDTPGHPIVLGEWRGAPEGAPTVLVYGHYDVQPPGPVELWHSPPFEPTVRDGRLYARGATDDKGQLFLHVKALEALLATRGTLPVNVLFLAEGEEETGSPHVASFVERRAESLACDGVVISDSAMLAPGIPAIVGTLRGIVSFEIEVFGPASELHSGEYGGTVVNPAIALARILASVHDDERRIVIPGFTERCREWPEAFRRQVESLPFDENRFRAEAGVPALGGEAGYTTLERRWMRPTFEVHGIVGGYTEKGMKSVVPPSAMAKVSCRLVPDQAPEEIDQLVRTHVERVAPAGVRVEVRSVAGAPAWHARAEGRLHAAAVRAATAVFGRGPVTVGGGGSIPVVADLERLLGAPVLLLGFGLPGENAHAPDEHFSLESLDLGMRTMARLWLELGEEGGVQ